MSLHLLVFSTLIFQSCISASSLNNETDRLSLINFKESISSDPYHILDSWNSSTHFYNWRGISCDHKHHRVTQLVLEGYQLSGTISPFIGNLSFLRLIDLDNNNFHREIPQDLGRLFRLQELHIQDNTLIGEFPVNVTSCSNLKYLAFGGNNLIGKIPMEIGSLHKLEGLYLLVNNFTGQIPTSLWNITSLRIFSLDTNNLEGNVPEDIGRLEKLKEFNVFGNKLSGAIFLLSQASYLHRIHSMAHLINSMALYQPIRSSTSLISTSWNLEEINSQVISQHPLQTQLSLQRSLWEEITVTCRANSKSWKFA